MEATMAAGDGGFGPTMAAGTGGFGPTMAAGAGGFGPTEPAGNGFGPTEPAGNGFGPTIAGGNGGFVDEYGPTMSFDSANGGMDETIKPDDSMLYTGKRHFGPVKQQMEDYGPTETVYMTSEMGFSPVTGWLVCIEGASKGMDYRIRSGYNYIGQKDNMDICIKGDNKISRERHALIAFDHEENVFFFGPADGKNIVRLNGKMVMNSVEIHAYDVLTIGVTKLLFIPLCGEKFRWTEAD